MGVRHTLAGGRTKEQIGPDGRPTVRTDQAARREQARPIEGGSGGPVELVQEVAVEFAEGGVDRRAVVGSVAAVVGELLALLKAEPS